MVIHLACMWQIATNISAGNNSSEWQQIAGLSAFLPKCHFASPRRLLFWALNLRQFWFDLSIRYGMDQRTAMEKPVIDMTDLQHDPQRLHERIVVLRAQTGDRAAFDELVMLYQERLTYYVHRVVQDWHQASDILQLVWLDVFRRLA